MCMQGGRREARAPSRTVCSALPQRPPAGRNPKPETRSPTHDGLRQFHQKSSCITQLTSGLHVVHMWSRTPPILGGTKPAWPTVWVGTNPPCLIAPPHVQTLEFHRLVSPTLSHISPSIRRMRREAAIDWPMHPIPDTLSLRI